MTAPLTPLSNCATTRTHSRCEGEQRRAQRLGGEADQKERFAPAIFGMVADPRREYRHHDLRHDDEPETQSDDLVGIVVARFSPINGQHRRVGKLKQHQGRREQNESVVLEEIDDAPGFRARSLVAALRARS